MSTGSKSHNPNTHTHTHTHKQTQRHDENITSTAYVGGNYVDILYVFNFPKTN